MEGTNVENDHTNRLYLFIWILSVLPLVGVLFLFSVILGIVSSSFSEFVELFHWLTFSTLSEAKATIHRASTIEISYFQVHCIEVFRTLDAMLN
jgi:hypothetical protein